MEKKKRPKAVYLLWLDHSHGNGWCEDVPALSLIQSIGIPIKEDKDTISITTSVSDDNEYITPLTIIKRTILVRQDLV